MTSRDQEESVALVLSIFKGENFVCKNIAGLKCQIEATCHGKTLESGVFNILTKTSEPIFNSQLAWQFTRRELKEIKVNKETVKVRCLLLSNDTKSPTELGYAILYVKDAFPLSTIGEVDPLKASSFTLLGTKEQWKAYQPKLQMQLHLEERSQSQQIIGDSSTGLTRKTQSGSPATAPNPTGETSKKLSQEVIDAASRVEINKNKMSDDPFSWQISDDDGCFVLGNPSENDDLYIFNITIISASNLHLLWNGRSPKKASNDDYVWQINYKVYGVDIKSDPFSLSHDDKSRRTFIGDKATARIRANGAMFCEYLEKSAVEFHVLRFQLSQDNELINEEVMGVSFVELQDLTKPVVAELQCTLEIVSEWGYPRVIDQREKPEVRVIFQLDAVPGFYSNCKSSAETPGEGQNDSDNVDIHKNVTALLAKVEEEKSNMENKVKTTPIEDVSRGVMDLNLNEIIRPKNLDQYTDESNLNRQLTTVQEENLELPNINVKTMNDHQLFNEPLIQEYQESESDQVKGQRQSKTRKSFDSSPESSSPSSSSNTSERSKSETTDLSSPEKENYSFHDEVDDCISSTSDTSNKDDLKHMMPSPGAFEVTIGLSKVWIKSPGPLNCIVLSYVHPLLDVMSKPVICTANPSSEIQHKKPNYRCMVSGDGISTIKVSIPKFSEKIINEPMTVEFRKYTAEFLGPPFGFSLIPVGSTLLHQEKNGSRTLKGCVDILKSATNVKVGVLHYFVKFTSIANSKSSPHSKQHANALKSSNERNLVDCSYLKSINKESNQNPQIDPSLVFKTFEELASWKLEQEQIYIKKKEQKERDYLRIVAEEVAKRDKERETVLREKLTEVKKKDKELSQQIRRVTEREDLLKSREFEVANAAQKLTADQTRALENTKISVRRMQEEYHIELSSLQRRNVEFEAELEKVKGKLAIFERKVEEKEELIRKLTAETHQRPDSRLSEKMKLMEQENTLLKKQVIDTEKSRDHYKKQSQTLCHKLGRLQEERDKQLKDENDSLRLQILASKEHAELKKERKAVADLSQTIRVLQDSAKTKVEHTAKELESNDRSNKRRVSESQGGKEIARLTAERNDLLSTGVYTQFDMVIKDMERKIVGLARGKDGDA